MQVTGVVANGPEAISKAADADVIVMNSRMPQMYGIEATTRITADPALAHVRILVFTT